MARPQSLTASLIARGFDRSHPIPFERGAKVQCSQCEALTVNGVPCHERGCPNERFECKGCTSEVPRGVRYCEDCN